MKVLLLNDFYIVLVYASHAVLYRCYAVFFFKLLISIQMYTLIAKILLDFCSQAHCIHTMACTVRRISFYFLCYSSLRLLNNFFYFDFSSCNCLLPCFIAITPNAILLDCLLAFRFFFSCRCLNNGFKVIYAH